MIARRMCRYSTSRARFIECKDRICRPARLERADVLKIFALKKQICSGRLIQPLARHHRRAFNERPKPLMRGANAFKIERHTAALWMRAKPFALSLTPSYEDRPKCVSALA